MPYEEDKVRWEDGEPEEGAGERKGAEGGRDGTVYLRPGRGEPHVRGN